MAEDRNVLEARAGDRDAFGRLYRRFSRAVFLGLAARLRGRQDAEDALQATFLSAWTNLPRLRRPSRLIGWRFLIARNKSRDWARDQARGRMPRMVLLGGSDELLAQLPPQRPRPRRSVPLGIAAVLLMGVALAIGHGRGERDGAIDRSAADDGMDAVVTLATVPRPKTGIVAAADTDFWVRLVSGGGIRVRGDSRWLEVGLDELGADLAQTDAQTRIVIRVDRDAPWQHVMWLMRISAEQQRSNLAFAVKSGDTCYLDATLPTDRGIGSKLPRHIACPLFRKRRG